MRKIAVITGTRAEYGLLYWVIRGIHEDPDLELQLLVTGMHLSPEFGMTVKDIERDGFPITEEIEMLLSSDTEKAISTSMGLGMIGFAKAYSRLSPDLIVVLGDRFEILSAVVAAIPFRIPIAHIHGGESTEGVIDESIRHAITKMSHVHFAATQRYRQRIIQMGENPKNVFCYGAPGLDNIKRLKLMSKAELLKELVISEEKHIGVVTYHPVTLEKNSSEKQVLELIDALNSFSDIFWIFTIPNADTGGRVIIEKIKNHIQHHPKMGKTFFSLGQLKYLSLLRYASVMVGNSSSGLIEAPSFMLPVVNIGDRQRGRIRGDNVIDAVVCKKEILIASIKRALSVDFKKSLKKKKNPYGDGNASRKIKEKIKAIELNDQLLKKKFYELSV